MGNTFTRDGAIWWIGFAGSVLAFIVASTTDLIPAIYVPKVQSISAILGFISGKLGNSPLKGEGE